MKSFEERRSEVFERAERMKKARRARLRAVLITALIAALAAIGVTAAVIASRASDPAPQSTGGLLNGEHFSAASGTEDEPAAPASEGEEPTQAERSDPATDPGEYVTLASDDPSGKPDDRPMGAPGETDVVNLTALFRDYVEGTVLKLCADDTVTAFLDGLGETYETVYECGDEVQNMNCTGRYAQIRTYWSRREVNSGKETTSGLSAVFERGSAVLTPLGMDFGYCLDIVVDLSVLPLEKDDGLARTKLYKEGDKLVYEYQTDRTARLIFTLSDGAIASFAFEWEKTTMEERIPD